MTITSSVTGLGSHLWQEAGRDALLWPVSSGEVLATMLLAHWTLVDLAEA